MQRICDCSAQNLNDVLVKYMQSTISFRPNVFLTLIFLIAYYNIMSNSILSINLMIISSFYRCYYTYLMFNNGHRHNKDKNYEIAIQFKKLNIVYFTVQNIVDYQELKKTINIKLNFNYLWFILCIQCAYSQIPLKISFKIILLWQ